MGKRAGGYYAVRVGRAPGVYSSWSETEQQVKGFTGAQHKKFATQQEAVDFLRPPNVFAAFQPATTSNRTAASTSNGSSAPKRAAQDDSSSASREARNKRARHEHKPSVHEKANAELSFPVGRTVWCDGSCIGNGQNSARAGVGVWWPQADGTVRQLYERLPGKMQTNNRAELAAVARILEMDDQLDVPLQICSDSAYTIDVFEKWLGGWEKRHWKTSLNKDVLNRDLIEYIESLLALRQPLSQPMLKTLKGSKDPPRDILRNVKFTKVRAHIGIAENEHADRLANTGAAMEPVDPVDYSGLTRINRELRRSGSTSSQSSSFIGSQSSSLIGSQGSQGSATIKRAGSGLNQSRRDSKASGSALKLQGPGDEKAKAKQEGSKAGNDQAPVESSAEHAELDISETDLLSPEELAELEKDGFA